MDQENKPLCSVCQIELRGTFCFQCGQKYKAGKISISQMIGDILSNLFSLEKSMPADLLRMLRTPNLLPKNYLNGFTRYYSSPGKMILYSLTLLGIHLAFVSPKILGLSFELTVEGNFIPSSMLFFLFLIPLLSSSSFLSDFKSEYSKIAHFVTAVYTACTFLILLIVLGDFIFMINPNILEIEISLVYIVLVIFWTSLSLFYNYSWKKILLHFIFNLLNFIALFTILVWIFN